VSSSLAAISGRQQTASSDAPPSDKYPQYTISQQHLALAIVAITEYHFESYHMDRTCSPVMAFVSEGCHPPQATISLSQTSLMTPEPLSPESYYSIKEEHLGGEDSKKPTKKRKSWGQELPTPKTNLPPRYKLPLVFFNLAMLTIIRKRAKTEDEKEQRRIERVLRNRQAAQSSRERKRQEVEKLEGEKMSIEEQNESLKERLMTVEHEKFLLAQQVAKMTAQMEAVRSGSLAPKELSPPPESDLIHHDNLIKQEILEEYPFALPTPQTSFGAPSTTFSSPTTATYSGYSTPATISLGFDALIATPYMTQHPAAMLCDLQCQSAEAYQAPIQPTTRQPAVTPSSLTTLLYLTLISTVCSELMYPLRMIFISLKMGSALRPLMITSTPLASASIRWLISTPANPAPLTKRANTPIAKKTSPTTTISTPMITLSQTSNLLHILLQHLLLSSPSLARPDRAATGRALRPKTASMMMSGNGVLGRVVHRVARYGDKAGFEVEGCLISLAGARNGRMTSSRILLQQGRRLNFAGVLGPKLKRFGNHVLSDNLDLDPGLTVCLMKAKFCEIHTNSGLADSSPPHLSSVNMISMLC